MVNHDSPDITHALLATSESVVSLPDSVYQRWMSKVPTAVSAFSDGRVVVPVSPRSTYLPNVADPAESSKALGLTRWELGIAPTGLVHALGLAEGVVDFVVRELVPRCSQCRVSMDRPRDLRDLSLASTGYLLAAPIEVPERVSLRERCEMLGCERALVGGKIVRADSLSEEDGTPIVALVAAGEAERLNEGVQSWFHRGGAPLTIYHVAKREDATVALGVVSRQWTCGVCSRSVDSPTRQVLVNLSPCGTCRGEGWLPDRAGRLMACRDCDGFGSGDDVRYYECGGVELSRVAELKFRELRSIVERSHVSERQTLLAALADVEQFGFGDYPLASPVGTLSAGERVLVTALIGQLSRVTGATYVVDGAHLREASVPELPPRVLTSVRVVAPQSTTVPVAKREKKVATESIRLAALDTGSLAISEVEFPIGALSVVEGVPGVGKSLLLAEMSHRFARRKKLAHLASFGGLKRCHLLGPLDPSTVSLLGVAALERDLAQEIARTRVAQQEGMTVDDLSLSSARYRCAACVGRGRLLPLQGEEGTRDQECDECGGALYDWRVADLPLMGRTVGDVLKTPLVEASQLLWRDPAVSFALERVAAGIETPLTLATPCAELSLEERGFVALAARLARLVSASHDKRARRGGLGGELVLIDGPRALTGCHLTIILALLGELVDSGATVICADLPRGLECFDPCVLRLRAADESLASAEKRVFADSRFARISVMG